MKTCSALLRGMSGMESKRLAAALADEIDVVGGWLGGPGAFFDAIAGDQHLTSVVFLRPAERYCTCLFCKSSKNAFFEKNL